VGGKSRHYSDQVVGGKGFLDNPVCPDLLAPQLIVRLQVAGHQQHGHVVKIR
jgi:hypothetical protein